tara:strand:- start:264 stop:437 length:174 start_codon:yes stop_codon:yes gene_type:complete
VGNAIYKTIINIAAGINVGLVFYSMIVGQWNLLPLAIVNLLLLSTSAFLDMEQKTDD